MKKHLLPLLSVVLCSSLIVPASVIANSPSSQKPTPTIENKKVKKSYQHPHSVFSWDSPGKIPPVLHPGSAKGAGMVEEPLKNIDQTINRFIEEEAMPGAVSLVARRGHIVQHEAYGYAARYTNGNKSEMDNPVPMNEDTIFDLASISKIFTTTAAMILYEQGLFDLDDPVAHYIPEFAQNGKENVTIRQLMTHTSGFTAWVPLYTQGSSREDRLEYVYSYGLSTSPGEQYTYSDLNMITLGGLVEVLSGQRLDQFVQEKITEPLKMTDTMYNPPASLKDRIAATEFQAVPDRGLVWGEVHDENAWSLDGVAGHAGVFSTAEDLAVFAHMILNDGTYGGKRILQPDTVQLLTENQLPQFPDDSHGLGWELGQGWYMDALTDGTTLGHTGYTGTSLVINRNNNTIAILLTNRVHPSRNTVSTNPVRRQFVRQVADAIPVSVPDKDSAWFSGYGNQLHRTLEIAIKDSQKQALLSFNTWYKIEQDYDHGYVETSSNGQDWTQVTSPVNGSSKSWERQEFQLPENTKYVRFRYTTDGSVNGRGWYLHNINITSSNKEPVAYDLSTGDWSERSY
ncbi:serine hydrolase domain-containing protein [Sediminibacillus albus]|uniref:CubicO group peptidase, beta-lactamase class C family n=1 Tax=Sediminibacillus albus TaxID=407036 RepID=A0A1G8YG06_9BACI|nr:serine hydrolase domain-containing protein [Sediminibacillus albus]SDK01577.1 CubicO group peptidase, beta-lactamase class C family [Sediminibacillus albus]